MFDWFGKKSNSALGVDFGTTVIKVVELSRSQDKFKLETYGLARLELGQETQRSVKEMGEILKETLIQAKVKTKKAFLAVPEASSFSTLIELPLMPEKELAQAIPYEARKYIPIPQELVYLDWIVLPQESLQPSSPAGSKNSLAEVQPAPPKMQVLLVAVLKEIVENFSQIASLAGLNVLGFEVESFSLMRSLLVGASGPAVLADIGTHSLNIDVVDDGYLRLSYEQDFPLLRDRAKPELHRQIIEGIGMEIQRAINLYLTKTGRKIQRGFLAGGGSFVAGLAPALKERLGIEVWQGNPFSNIMYLPVLKPAIDELGPSLSVAVGLAMRQLV